MDKYLIAVLVSIIVSMIVSICYEHKRFNHYRSMYRLETVVKLSEMSKQGILTEWIFDYVTKGDPLLQALKNKYFEAENGRQ